MHLKKNHITCTELLAIFCKWTNMCGQQSGLSPDFCWIESFLDYPWIIPILSLYYPSIISEHSLDYSWCIPALSLDYQSLIPGITLYYPWIILGFSQDYPLITSEFSQDYPWLQWAISDYISHVSIQGRPRYCLLEIFFPTGSKNALALLKIGKLDSMASFWVNLQFSSFIYSFSSPHAFPQQPIQEV